MQHTKITITEEEFDVMTNSDFLLKKADVIEKIKLLLLQLNDSLSTEAKNLNLPGDVLKLHGKISKGENYMRLPYLILDYPRIFNKENVFAFRSMFWWGNYFVFTLHLQGEYFENYKYKLAGNLKKDSTDDLYIKTTGNAWKHHLEERELNKPVDLNSAEFIKISRKLKLENWKEVPAFGKETFVGFMRLLGTDNMS